MRSSRLLLVCSALFAGLAPCALLAAPEPITLLNVSYDATRTFYEKLNPAFATQWKTDTQQDATVAMAYNDGYAQAKAVLDGLDADVVTLDQASGIDLLAERGHLLPENWRALFPNGSVPFTSLVEFVVRGDNPKAIKDWDDLLKPGVIPIISNPKSSGDGRYCYLAAWAYALKKNNGDEEKARDFVKQLFARATIIDTGGLATVSTFTEHSVGDVLLTYENQARAIQQSSRDPGNGQFQVVVPSLSIRADLPVAIVDKNADKHGTRPVAQAYLQYLFSPAAQELAAQQGLRPTDKDVLAKHADQFKTVDLIDVETTFGGWKKAQQIHFADGGVFDQVYSR